MKESEEYGQQQFSNGGDDFDDFEEGGNPDYDDYDQDNLDFQPANNKGSSSKKKNNQWSKAKAPTRSFREDDLIAFR